MSESIRPEQIVLEADVFLGDWSYGVHSAKRTTDAKATFFFADDEDMRPITPHETRAGQGKKIAGKRFRMVLIAEDDAPEPAAAPAQGADKGQYGQEAKELKLSGFLRRPQVWQALGTDAEFREWVTRERSIVSKRYSEYDGAGEGRNVACHVRRAGESGTAHKPVYACVPMTDDEHQIQHLSGESAIFVRAMVLQGKTNRADDPSLEQHAQEWFDKQRIQCVETWAWQALKEFLGFDSMADAHPDEVFDWALHEGLDAYLPECYRRSAA